MAAPTSPHRCVLGSRRLPYHRGCREQSDLMLTVNITFVLVLIHQPAEQRLSGRLQALLPAALPEAGGVAEAPESSSALLST